MKGCLSDRLYEMAHAAEEICRNVTTDYRVRDGATSVASILKLIAHTQARIEAGTISIALDRPLHRHD